MKAERLPADIWSHTLQVRFAVLADLTFLGVSSCDIHETFLGLPRLFEVFDPGPGVKHRWMLSFQWVALTTTWAGAGAGAGAVDGVAPSFVVCH